MKKKLFEEPIILKWKANYIGVKETNVLLFLNKFDIFFPHDYI